MNLNFPKYEFKLSEVGGKRYIFDEQRRKNIMLTPEEWVRQHLIKFLIEDRKFPSSLIAVERAFEVNKISKRFDVLVFGKSGKPLFLIECKSPSIKISQDVFFQVSVYNKALQVPYLLVSNGLQHLLWKFSDEMHNFEFLNEIPIWADL